ncbi:MAG TPA: DUF4142 domain-containing protein [Thermodesulfobacteriota bacterium]|nr:DUF4142 domain-containing protein [Thermodesulfobacteriota bacterium]
MKSLVIALSALAFVVGTTFAAGAQQTQGMDRNMDRNATTASTQGLSKTDQKFAMNAAKDSQFEIQMSQLAAQKATNPQVKEFAQKLADDHTKLSSDLSGLASQKGLTLPTSLDRKDQKELDKFSKESSSKFDKKYLSAMVKDHKKDIKSFKSEAKSGKDPDLQNWASSHISALQEHLTMAQNLEKNMK